MSDLLLEGLVFLFERLVRVEGRLNAFQLLLQRLHVLHLIFQPQLQLLVLSFQVLSFLFMVIGKLEADLE
jgi:hypothetical protein